MRDCRGGYRHARSSLLAPSGVFRALPFHLVPHISSQDFEIEGPSICQFGRARQFSTRSQRFDSSFFEAKDSHCIVNVPAFGFQHHATQAWGCAAPAGPWRM
jgi:hypothetical protein